MAWISVKDRLPDEGGYYLAYMPIDYKPIRVLPFNNEADEWLMECSSVEGLHWIRITHWMPLPNVPTAPSEEN